MKPHLALIGALALAVVPEVSAQAQPKVRIIYLVPSDKDVKFHYQLALEDAIENVQSWFHQELAGESFFVNDPVVEVLRTPHDASWYSSNPNGPDFLWLWNNVLDDAGPLTGWSFDDPSNRWVFYIDADPACGQYGGAGTSGVAVISANDLRGLTGEATISPCPNEPPDTAGRCRWVGGLGHELGHAFNLPHPEACDASLPSCPSNALMWLGFRIYPDTYLLPEDEVTLGESPFIQPIDLGAHARPCDVIAPKISLAVNGDTASVVERSNPVRVGLSVDPGTLSDAVAWYYAIVADGAAIWFTRSGISVVPRPLEVGAAATLSDVSIWEGALPGNRPVSYVFLMIDADGVVAMDVITAVTDSDVDSGEGRARAKNGLQRFVSSFELAPTVMSPHMTAVAF